MKESIRRVVGMAVMAVAVAAPGAWADGDAERGQQLANMCQGCHDIEGFSTAFPVVYKVPRIRGQSAGYIVAALQEYAAGRRYPASLNRMVSMPAIAASLTEQDMADLAAYYSSQ